MLTGEYDDDEDDCDIRLPRQPSSFRQSVPLGTKVAAATPAVRLRAPLLPLTADAADFAVGVQLVPHAPTAPTPRTWHGAPAEQNARAEALDMLSTETTSLQSIGSGGNARVRQEREGGRLRDRL